MVLKMIFILFKVVSTVFFVKTFFYFIPIYGRIKLRRSIVKGLFIENLVALCTGFVRELFRAVRDEGAAPGAAGNGRCCAKS